MIDEIVNFKNAAVEAFTVSKNSLFECLHKIYGAMRFTVATRHRLLVV